MSRFIASPDTFNNKQNSSKLIHVQLPSHSSKLANTLANVRNLPSSLHYRTHSFAPNGVSVDWYELIRSKPTTIDETRHATRAQSTPCARIMIYDPFRHSVSFMLHLFYFISSFFTITRFRFVSMRVRGVFCVFFFGSF